MTVSEKRAFGYLCRACNNHAQHSRGGFCKSCSEEADASGVVVLTSQNDLAHVGYALTSDGSTCSSSARSTSCAFPMATVTTTTTTTPMKSVMCATSPEQPPQDLEGDSLLGNQNIWSTVDACPPEVVKQEGARPGPKKKRRQSKSHRGLHTTNSVEKRSGGQALSKMCFACGVKHRDTTVSGQHDGRCTVFRPFWGESLVRDRRF